MRRLYNPDGKRRIGKQEKEREKDKGKEYCKNKSE